MHIHKDARMEVFTIGLLLFFMLWIGDSYVVHAAWLHNFTEAQKQAIRKEVQDAIQKAEELWNERKYAEALRLLFDTMDKESQTWYSPPYSPNAADVLTKLEQSLIHADQSPLMQLFRDPEFPFEEKLVYIDELRELAHRAASRQHERETVLFRGKYHGTLVQLMLSPKLNQGEKFDVLFWIETVIREEYTSATQRNQILEEIAHLQTLAEQERQKKRYVQMFILLTEAEKKARDIFLIDENLTLEKQIDQSVKEFVGAEDSSLMKLFRSRWISSKKKARLWSELKEFSNNSRTATDTIHLQGKEYDGTLVQILSNPKVSWLTKLNILGHIKEMIK